LVDLWGFGPPGARFEPPPPDRIDEARQGCGARHLRITARDELIKAIPGLKLNLSAVAKGFGVDATARVLQDFGIDNFLVEIGGEVVARGRNPQGRRWRVAIESPLTTGDFGAALDCYIELDNKALATSGNYRQYFTDAAGHRYTHILDPRTGQPVDWAPLGVSVVADTCLAADGLATTLFVLGAEAGRPWIERTFPRTAALFLETAGPGLPRRFATANFPALHSLGPPDTALPVPDLRIPR
jgi:thiamine biosynthesis lipoprotein